MKTLRIGIIGAGGIVRLRHLPGLRQLPGLEITAVSNSSPDSARRFCQEFAPEAEIVSRWQDLAARSDLDIVWIGATPHLHAPATIAALEAGKHVFCQARMARDLSEARQMLDAAVAHPDQVTMLCPPPQGLDWDGWIRDLLAQKIVGDVRQLRLQSWNAQLASPDIHWRLRSDLSGKNMLSLGIHTEIIQRWLGRLIPTAAKSAIYTPGADLPQALTVAATVSSGAQAVLDFSGVYPGPVREQLEIIGSTGTLLLDYKSGEVRLSTTSSSEILTPPPDKLRPWQVEADFIHAVRHPEAPRPHPDFHDGYAYMEVVDRVWDLLQNRR